MALSGSKVDAPKTPAADDPSQDRRAVILEAARSILVEDGLRKLTLRKVASRAQIHLKTLQHYFESKNFLVKETTQYIADEISRELQSKISPLIAKKNYEGAFETAINVMLDSCENEENWRVFFELWALAGRDEYAEESIDLVFANNRYNLELIIASANPRISRKDVSLRAALVASQMSGLALFLNSRQPHHPELEGLKEEAIRRMLELVHKKP